MGAAPRESISISGFNSLRQQPGISPSSTASTRSWKKTHGAKNLTSSTVEHLGVRAVPERVTPIRQPVPEAPPAMEAVPPSHSMPSVREDSAALGAFRALASVLAARLLLLLGVLGAFVLAWVAAHAESFTPLCVLVAYGVLVVGPLAWLDWHRGPGSGV